MRNGDIGARERVGLLIGFAASAACGAGCVSDDDGPVDPVPPNAAPVTTAAIPSQTVSAGNHVSLDLSTHFSDPDGDPLTYRATSSDALIAALSVSDRRLTVVGVSRGVTQGGVTARDASGREARQVFEVAVPNRNPIAIGEIAPVRLDPGEGETRDVAPYFLDPDGDALTFAATSSDAFVAGASISGSRLTVGGWPRAWRG